MDDESQDSPPKDESTEVDIESSIFTILLSRTPISVIEKGIRFKIEEGSKILNKMASESCETPQDYFDTLRTLAAIEGNLEEVDSIIKTFEELSKLLNSFHLIIESILKNYKGGLFPNKDN